MILQDLVVSGRGKGSVCLGATVSVAPAKGLLPSLAQMDDVDPIHRAAEDVALHPIIHVAGAQVGLAYLADPTEHPFCGPRWRWSQLMVWGGFASTRGCTSPSVWDDHDGPSRFHETGLGLDFFLTYSRGGSSIMCGPNSKD